MDHKQKAKEEMAEKFNAIKADVNTYMKQAAAQNFCMNVESVNRYFRGLIGRLATAQSLYDYFIAAIAKDKQAA